MKRKQLEFIFNITTSLVDRQELHQKTGEVMFYLLDASKGEEDFSVPVPKVIAKKLGMSFLRARYALKTLEDIGAISIKKEYPRSAELHIHMNYLFKSSVTE